MPTPQSYADVVLADSPLAYYRLDETSGTTMTDSSGSGRNGTYVGSPTLGAASLVASDTAGKSVDFQGGGQRGEVAYASWMDPAAFSVETVIRADTWPANAVIVSKNHVAGGGWLLRVDSGVLKFWTANVNTWSSLDYAISTGTTYHIAATYDGTTARLYVDGVERASAARTITTNTDSLGIGANYNDSLTQRFDGRIDEVAFYGTALSAKRIRLRSTMVHKNIGPYSTEVLADSPLTYLPLDETTGTVAEDASPNNRDGTYLGTYTLGQASLIATTTGSSSIDVAGGGRVEVPYGAWMDAAAWSVEALFVTDSNSGYRVLIGRRSNGSERWMLRQDHNQMLFYANNGGWWSVSLGVVNPGQVYHLVATYDGATARCYLDGVLVVSNTNTIRTDGTPPNLHAGANQGDLYSEQFDGRIDEVSYYGTALTETRVREHWAASQVARPGAPAAPPLDQAKEIDTAGVISVLPWLGQAKEVDTAQAITVVREPDDFAAARVVTGLDGSLDLDMTGLTLETGEPNPHAATRTAWLAWTAPDEPPPSMRFMATGGASPTLAVYTGSAVSALTPVVSDADGDLSWVPVGSVTYYVQVGTASASNDVSLRWLTGDPQPYDAFETPLVVADGYGLVEVTTANGTLQTGEPSTGVAATSWLQWTAPAATEVVFAAEAVDGETTRLDVYTGTAVGSLTSVATASGTGRVTVTWNPTEGTTYYVRVGSAVDLRDFTVDWAVQTAPVPPVVLPEPPPPDDYPDEAPPQLPRVHLRVEVYDRSGQTLITEVPRRVKVQGQEPLNEPGVGRLLVPLGDEILVAYPTLFDWGNVVKFWLGSTCISGFVIKRRRATRVDATEWSGMVLEVSGPTLHHWLQHFIVKHDGTPRPDSPDTRAFTWAAKPGEWYNAADWNATIRQWSMQDPPSNKKKNKPKNWKVRTAKWINTQGGGKGWRYFRRNVQIGADGTLVRLFASADEWFRVYLDGELVLSGDKREIGYTEFQKYDTVLSKGSHTIAAMARAFPSKKGDGNDSFLFAMCEVDLDGKIIRPALRVSNDDWKAYVGNPPPAWNRALVMRAVVMEAQARGVEAATWLTLGFSKTSDTAGLLWDDRFNQEVRVGTSGLDLQAQLSEGGEFDVWVDPASMTLKAWKRRGQDRSASVALEPGRNLLDWEVEETDEVENEFLIQYDGGWTGYVAPVSRATYGAREVYVSLDGAKDDDAAKRIVRRAARGIASAQNKAGTGEIRKRPMGQPEGGLVGVEGAYPFLDFGVGDTVMAPNASGKMVKQRILALSFTEDDHGNLSFDPEMEEVRGV